MAQIRSAHSGKYAELDREAADFRDCLGMVSGSKSMPDLHIGSRGEGETVSRMQRVQAGRNRCCGYRLIR
jgi:hypothetical protein